MKTRNRILSLLSSRKPATEADKLGIISFCHKKKMKVYFPKNREAFEPLTFEQFIGWLKVPHYGLGEVITDADGAVRLVSDFVAGESVSGAYLTSGGEFRTEPVPVPKVQGNRKSSDKERTELQRAMNRAELTWNPYRESLMSGVRPAKNYYVTIWVIDEMVGMGIFKEVDENGNLILYCHTDGKGHLKYDNHLVWGPAIDCAVREARGADRAEIISELNHANLIWHARIKRFEPMNLRKRIGEKYFYITTDGRVLSSLEKRSSVDGERFKIGNYFHSSGEAEEFKRRMILVRNEQLTGKLPGLD